MLARALIGFGLGVLVYAALGYLARWYIKGIPDLREELRRERRTFRHGAERRTADAEELRRMPVVAALWAPRAAVASLILIGAGLALLLVS